MFSLSPQPQTNARYYTATRSQEKSAWRSRRRARRMSQRHEPQSPDDDAPAPSPLMG